MKFKSNIEVQAGIEDKDGQVGSNGQILASTGSQVDWIDQSTLVSGSAERVSILVKNGEGTALVKGDPVYIIGSVGASARLEVGLCDASDSSKMPCVGLLEQDLLDNGEGTAVTAGKLRNLVTTPIDGQTTTENDTIYVKAGGSSGSSLTITKPTGSTNLIQNVGQVGRVSTSSDGNFVVSAIMRTNDVPNLPEGRIWIGDGNTIVSDTVYVDEPNNRVGIGETSPTSKLSIKGTQAAIDITRGTTGDSKWEFSSDSTAMYISEMSTGTRDYIMTLKETTGNVGIGTTSPTHLLTLENASSPGLKIKDTTQGATLLAFSQDSNSHIGTYSSHPLVLDTNSTERMRITSAGDVGIGATPTTGYKLDVVKTSPGYSIVGRHVSGGKVGIYNSTGDNGIGTINNYNFNLFTNNSGPQVTLTTAGNVGIGTTSPSEKLEVAGNIKVDNVLLSNQQNTDIDSAAAEVVAQVSITDYTAAFFDFVVKKGTNVRSGTVYACHDGTNVEFTETSTNDLGDTSDVTLSVDISGGNMRLLATVTSDDWSVKSLIRAI